MEKSGSRQGQTLPPLEILKNRADFVAAQSGDRAGAVPFLVLRGKAANRAGFARIGFTVTKKVGSSVTRNRIRRRLKEAARRVFLDAAEPGYDYVVIARPQAESCEFQCLLDDMKRALLRLASLPK